MEQMITRGHREKPTSIGCFRLCFRDSYHWEVKFWGNELPWTLVIRQDAQPLVVDLQDQCPDSESESHSHVQLFATIWTVVHQAPLSTEFSRQEYWSGFPFPSPGDLPHLGIKPRSQHCRQVLYQLSHERSPCRFWNFIYIYIYIYIYMYVFLKSL